MHMRKNRTPALVGKTVVAFFIVAVCALWGCNVERSGIYPGEVAPNIVGVDPISGEKIALHDVAGDIVLVNFWATWCTPCMQELPALQRFYDAVKNKGITVVGVAVNDARPLVVEALKRYSITFPILLDEDGKSKRKYELRGFPESFVLDSKRRVLMVPDPGVGAPVAKIVGPRDWAHPDVVTLFSNLKKEATPNDSNAP